MAATIVVLPLISTYPFNMNDSKVLYAASFGVAASLAALGVLSWQHSEGRPPYPPGPKGYPLIGSVLDVPQDVPIWQAFGSIARQHSEWLTSSSKYVTQGAAASRHRRAVHENAFKRVSRFE